MGIKPPREHDINKPIPVGPEEEKEEDARRGVISKDVYESGKDAMIGLMKDLEKRGYLGAREDSYKYLDDAIDYEVRIPLKHRDKQEIRQVFRYIEESFAPPPGYYISTGFRVPGMDMEQALEDHYLTLEGLVILGAHYQESGRLVANIETSLVNYEGLMRNLREDPTEIFVRMFWSPGGNPPLREDYSNGIIDRDKTWSED